MATTRRRDVDTQSHVAQACGLVNKRKRGVRGSEDAIVRIKRKHLYDWRSTILPPSAALVPRIAFDVVAVRDCDCEAECLPYQQPVAGVP